MSRFKHRVYFLQMSIACTALLSLGCYTAVFAQVSALFPLSSTASDMVLPGSGGTEFHLSKYFENHRILLMFIPSDAAVEAKGYLASLAKNERKLADRDLQVVAVVNEDSPLRQQQYPSSSIVVVARKEYIPASTPGDDAAPLFVLIEKNKTVTLREPTFVDFGAIMNKIDSSPARRAEIKARRH